MTSSKIYNPPSRVHIRWMIRRDLPEILAIEGASFPNDPWGEAEFLQCLRQRNCIGLVAEIGEQVVGFVLYELHKGYLRVLKLAVSPCRRYEGIGTKFVDTLITKLRPDRRPRLVIDVSEDNTPAQIFSRGRGLIATKVIRRAGDRDTYRFEFSI